ncbi:4191_t:CDS:1 [Acaulospora colombiana]|uniref:4191_t:CDS:1 n=1 Tax=Acaulospora colombiana TaxID=27376 RepID=A0ACA9MIM5_9GLOM|nr:4191_t:CDS:1 [Acaulospora colombiana]
MGEPLLRYSSFSWPYRSTNLRACNGGGTPSTARVSMLFLFLNHELAPSPMGGPPLPSAPASHHIHWVCLAPVAKAPAVILHYPEHLSLHNSTLGLLSIFHQCANFILAAIDGSLTTTSLLQTPAEGFAPSPAQRLAGGS